MHRDSNLIGPMIVKLRYQREWTQDDLVGKLLYVDCHMTRDILANIETQRSIVKDTQIEYFAEIFGVKEGSLFPDKRRFNGRMVGLDVTIKTRRPCPNRRPRSRARLAEPAKK